MVDPAPVSLGTNSLWVAAILNDGRNLPATAVLLGFFVIFALLYHIELILSAARGNDLLGKYGGSFAMLITAGFMAAVLYVEWNAAPGIRGAWVLGACAATALTGALLRLGSADALPRRLSPGYWLQAGALLVLAVPMMFKGVDVPLGWGAMALTFAVYGAVVNLPSARSFALLCWSLSLMALLWYATDGGHDFINGTEGRGPVVWLHIGGTAFRDYTIIAWLLALAGHVIASLNGRRFESTTAPPDNNLDPLLMRVAIVADAVWAAAAVAALEPLGATLALAVFAWLAAVAAGLDRRGNWAVHSMGMLVVAVIKWALVDMLIGFWSAPTASIWALHYTPVLNPLMGMGLLLAVSMVVEFWIFRRRLWDFLIRWTGPELDGRRSFLLCAAVVIAIVTFGLSFEIERVVELALMRGSPMIWPPGQLKQMGWTILWTLAVCVFVGLAFFVESPEQRSGWVRTIARMPLFLAAKFLLIDTLFFRVMDGAALATVGANLQMVTALVVVGGLALAWYVGRWPDESGVPGTRLQFGSAVLAALVLLWCGTLEIDRAYERLAGAAGMGVRAELAKQVAWSIYWSLFATGAIAAGFHVRSSAVRYFGLGLFGLTLLKVVLVDMSQVGRGYRIFSFMALGLLLLGTSVLYGKLTPRLLGKVSEES